MDIEKKLERFNCSDFTFNTCFNNYARSISKKHVHMQFHSCCADREKGVKAAFWLMIITVLLVGLSIIAFLIWRLWSAISFVVHLLWSWFWQYGHTCWCSISMLPEEFTSWISLQYLTKITSVEWIQTRLMSKIYFKFQERHNLSKT